jgi:hypothetical protein
MEKQVLKTKFRKKIDERDINLYNDWLDEIVKEGAMKTAVYAFLQKRYRLNSLSAVWRACKRAEKLLEITN